MLQDAVDAVLDGDFGVACFDVNIARSPLERGEDDGFDQADNRTRRGVPRQAIAGNGLVALGFVFADLKREGLGRLLEHALRLLGALEEVADLPRRRNLDKKLLAKQKRKFVAEQHVAGIGYRNRQQIVLHFERNKVVAEHQVRWNRPEQFRIDALFAQIDEFLAIAFGKFARLFALGLLVGPTSRCPSLHVSADP